MNAQFEWLIEESGESHTTAITAPFRPMRAVPHRVCLGLLSALPLILLTAWTGARYRYRQAVACATSEIQALLDLETQIVASCDRHRFLGLQDPAAPRWVAYQAQRLHEQCSISRAVPGGPYASSLLGFPAHVQNVALHGDLAWVQITTGKAHERHVCFYRWTERGWVHAPPDPSFWGEPIVWQHERLLVQATMRDQPYGKVLAAHSWDVAQAVCGALGCKDDLALRVTFLPNAMGQLPRLSSRGLLLPSPWLTGIPESQITSASRDQLTYWTAYYVAAAAIDGLAPGNLNPTQGAILAEYARFLTEGNLETAPILRRVADRRGIDALPALLRSLPDAHSLSDVLPHWLALSAGMPDTYYGLLVDIAQDPATPTCQETFGLVTREEEAQLVKWIELHHGWSACAVKACPSDPAAPG